MAQQMYNPFQPMAQAQQGLNQALVTAGKLKRQRKRNKLKNMLTRAEIRQSQAKTANERRNLLKKKRANQYVDLRRQQQNALQQAYQREGQAYQQDDEATQLGLAMPASDPMSEPRVDEEPREFSSTRARFKYWKQVDPERANEIAKSVFDQAKQLHDMGDPQAAAQHVTENLGFEAQFKGGEEYEIKKHDGDLVRLNAQTGETEVIRKGQGEEDLSAKEEEIQRYLDNNIAETRQQAIKLAEGQYEIGQDALGNSVIIDKTTGEVVKPLSGPEQPQQKQPQRQQPEQEREPFLSVDETKEGVGPVSGIKQMMNNLIGPFTPGQLFEDTEKARNKLRMFRQRIKPYLMVSSRGAVYEQQNIEEFLPNPDQFFTDPDATKDQLQNLHSMINATIEKKQELIDKGQITADQKKAFTNDIRKLQTALSYLPDEKVLFSPEPAGQGAKQNITVQDIQSMSAQDLQQLDVEQLNQEQTRAALQRLEQLEGGQ